MKSFNLIPAILLGLILSISACTESTPNKTPTKTDYLTAHPWRLTAATISPAYNGITDFYANMMDACEKDGTDKYNVGGSYTEDEGPTKCEPSDPQVTNGTWAWGAGETSLTITTSSTLSVSNVTVDANTLKGNITQVEGGVTYTISFTFSK